MLNINLLSLFVAPYSVYTLVAVAFIAFALGFVTKRAVMYKQKKKILKLEDEMLNNHSRILSLEKKLAEAKKGANNNHFTPEITVQKKMEKVS